MGTPGELSAPLNFLLSLLFDLGQGVVGGNLQDKTGCSKIERFPPSGVTRASEAPTHLGVRAQTLEQIAVGISPQRTFRSKEGGTCSE